MSLKIAIHHLSLLQLGFLQLHNRLQLCSILKHTQAYHTLSLATSTSYLQASKSECWATISITPNH